MIGPLADGVVGAVKYGHRHKAWLSGFALLLTLLIGVAYLTFGALRWNPLRSVYRVNVELPASGGLMANQDVTLRGIPVGKIEHLSLTPAGVDAQIKINEGVEVSDTSKARVAGLSAAGEQYLDFDGGTGEAPFLADGATFALGRTEIPVTLGELLAHSDGMLKQVDTQKLEIIKKELGMSKEGPQKLSNIVEGGTYLISTLDGVLPQTTRMLNTSRVTLQLVSDKQEGMKVTTANLNKVLGGVNRMTGGFRQLVEQAPKTFAAVNNVFDDNSDAMVQLLGDLTTTSELMYLRVPALNALFPNGRRGSVFDSLSSVVHDNGFWLSGDIYPRYSCDYGTPRRPPADAGYPEPYLYNYCRDDDPAVLIRGAKNAPRPPGDDTYGPPAGLDMASTTDSTPEGQFAIPTPYGGPTLPIEPPR